MHPDGIRIRRPAPPPRNRAATAAAATPPSRDSAAEAPPPPLAASRRDSGEDGRIRTWGLRIRRLPAPPQHRRRQLRPRWGSSFVLVRENKDYY